MINEKTSLERYNAAMEGTIETDPIERLRFFCSIALTGRDWFDVEQFFYDIEAERKDLQSRSTVI